MPTSLLRVVVSMSVPLSVLAMLFRAFLHVCPLVARVGCEWWSISACISISNIWGQTQDMCCLRVSPGIHKQFYQVTCPDSFLSSMSSVPSGSWASLLSSPTRRKIGKRKENSLILFENSLSCSLSQNQRLSPGAHVQFQATFCPDWAAVKLTIW